MDLPDKMVKRKISSHLDNSLPFIQTLLLEKGAANFKRNKNYNKFT
jgi:hypothetical protein